VSSHHVHQSVGIIFLLSFLDISIDDGDFTIGCVLIPIQVSMFADIRYDPFPHFVSLTVTLRVQDFLVKVKPIASHDGLESFPHRLGILDG
jgi:hypothetical protein